MRLANKVAMITGAAKQMPPAPGVQEVLVPGEPEANAREKRGREGIQLPEATWSDLAQAGKRFSIPMPEHYPVGP